MPEQVVGHSPLLKPLQASNPLINLSPFMPLRVSDSEGFIIYRRKEKAYKSPRARAGGN